MDSRPKKVTNKVLPIHKDLTEDGMVSQIRDGDIRNSGMMEDHKVNNAGMIIWGFLELKAQKKIKRNPSQIEWKSYNQERTLENSEQPSIISG